jgi:hypothetical protein
MRLHRAGMIAVVIAPGLLLLPIGTAGAQRPADCHLSRSGETVLRPCGTLLAGRKKPLRLQLDGFGVVHASIQLPGPQPQDLKNLNCEKLKALKWSVTTINGTLVDKASIYAGELEIFRQHYLSFHCDKQLNPSTYCSQISSHIANMESKITQATTDTQTLNDYKSSIEAVARQKRCFFEQWNAID